MDIRKKVGCDTYVGAFKFAGMPMAEAERNVRLFAREVMPELKKLGEQPSPRAAAAAGVGSPAR